jgi:hypothetical protein
MLKSGFVLYWEWNVVNNLISLFSNILTMSVHVTKWIQNTTLLEQFQKSNRKILVWYRHFIKKWRDTIFNINYISFPIQNHTVVLTLCPQRAETCANKTSYIPPLFNEVSVSNQDFSIGFLKLFQQCGIWEWNVINVENCLIMDLG